MQCLFLLCKKRIVNIAQSISKAVVALLLLSFPSLEIAIILNILLELGQLLYSQEQTALYLGTGSSLVLLQLTREVWLQSSLHWELSVMRSSSGLPQLSAVYRDVVAGAWGSWEEGWLHDCQCPAANAIPCVSSLGDSLGSRTEMSRPVPGFFWWLCELRGVPGRGCAHCWGFPAAHCHQGLYVVGSNAVFGA